MGIYINPGKESFMQIRKMEYVDKTGMIDVINGILETPAKMTCVSRPRRFGKSFAAKMLAAYYDKSCNSRELFSDLEIGQSESFEKYLNKLHVIYLDITYFLTIIENKVQFIHEIQKAVIKEIQEYYPQIVKEHAAALPVVLADVTRETGVKFFVIIDEWDALFREAKNDDTLQREYVQFLRGMFKGGIATDKTIAGAYITGILPIKKYGTESAMTDFIEYTMVDPGMMTPYVGFTESEVKSLCAKYNADFDSMKQWYDGYSFDAVVSIYSPNSVMRAIQNKKYKNYWTKTESYESLNRYISMNMDGLKDAVIQMLGGSSIRINPMSFQNDMTSFRTKDNVLTLLVHLGYLAYNENTCKVHIPNLEVTDSFNFAVQETNWSEVNKSLADADELLDATIAGEAEKVAASLENIHMSTSSVLQYNDENSLSCALMIAYYTAKRDYMIIRELPAGKGFADFAFIPRKTTEKPAMIVELKYNKNADTAIQQIKEKRYAGALKNYAGRILLVGINYDKETKTHTCVIEHA